MIINRSKAPREGLMVGLAILVVGVLIGSVLRPLDLLGDSARAGDADERLHRSLRRPSTPGQVPDNGLASLALDIAPEHVRLIQEVRDRAMAQRVIIQEDRHTVPATVVFDDQPMAATIRIKGDWIDHVNSAKWSYRITLEDGRVLGMRVFSIQRPETRGQLWEWFFLEAARRENILAPRATFVNVVVNDNPLGVFLLEEHFRKEMLESMGRREGPIVRFDEGSFWDALLTARHVSGIAMPLPATSGIRAWNVDGKEIAAFEERRLSEDRVLSQALYSAVEKMRALQRAVFVSQSWGEKGRRLLELEAVRGTTIDTLMDTDRLAHAHALASLFQLTHPMIWHNMRFYHNPLLDRLEPVMFDNMPHIELRRRDPVVFLRASIMKQFATSAGYYNGVFRYLGDICRPDYLERLFEDLDDETQLYAAALEAERPLGERYRVAAMKQRLRAQQVFLRSVIEPADPINFSCFYEVEDAEGGPISGVLEIAAWSTTWTPVVLEGFRFGNGRIVAASSCVANPPPNLAHEGKEGVVLPKGGQRVLFRLSMDERLTNLENIQQIKQAIREHEQRQGGTARIALEALYRPIAVSTVSNEPLRFLKRNPIWVGAAGRPGLPTLEEALARYPFLEFDVEAQRLSVTQTGADVEGDLLLPRGHPLYVRAGTRLRFGGGAVLLTESSLVFEGRKSAPVVLEPAEGAVSWGGVVVLQAGSRSLWTHVEVRGTSGVERSGWMTTGGITFYHSQVTMKDCKIDGTVAEDGLNIFGTRMELERVELSDCVSDSFDGDFVTGTIKSCRFRDGGGDGIDLSGSNCSVETCHFANLADKAISAGENSEVRIVGGEIERTSLGVVSKDSSRVEVDGLEIRSVDRYAFAAYIKKPEFGPSSIVARGVTVGDAGMGVHLIQHGCSLQLDDDTAATRRIDVQRLYREGVLGN